MGIQNLSDDVILVTLPVEPHRMNDELKNINEIVAGNIDCSVIIDFSQVEIITSSDITNLILLRSTLCERGRQLILCNVSFPTKGIFTTARLDTVFELADDKQAALAAIESAN